MNDNSLNICVLKCELKAEFMENFAWFIRGVKRDVKKRVFDLV